MNELPDRWVHARLSQLIGPGGEFSDGDWVESKDQDPNGTIRLLQLADVGDGIFLDKSNRFVNEEQFVRLHCTLVLPGDVLIARMPDPLGRACLAPPSLQKRITVVDVAIVRPGPASVSADWLMHCLNSPQIRRAIQLEASGTTRRRIARGRLAALALPIPPRAEQVRIASKVDGAMSRIRACRARLNRVPQILKRFREAVLEAAVSGTLTKEWRSTHISPRPWQQTRLSDVAIAIDYGSATKSEKAGKVPVLRMGNIQEGKLDWTKLVYTSDRAEAEKYKLVPGDVLFNRTNSPELVGKTAVYHGERPAIFAGYLIRIRCRAAANPDFIGLCLNSPLGRRYSWSVKTDGVSQSNINATNLAAFSFQLPPREEQDEIVRRVSALFSHADSIMSLWWKGSSNIETLVQALLGKAFQGKLVSQDPADEPASVMLERIKTDRDRLAEVKDARTAARPERRRGRGSSTGNGRRNVA